MTTTMTPDLYVHQALKILGEGLEPHIRAVMAPHLGELEWIQVLPACRGRGVGQSIVNELLRRMARRPCC